MLIPKKNCLGNLLIGNERETLIQFKNLFEFCFVLISYYIFFYIYFQPHQQEITDLDLEVIDIHCFDNLISCSSKEFNFSLIRIIKHYA